MLVMSFFSFPPAQGIHFCYCWLPKRDTISPSIGTNVADVQSPWVSSVGDDVSDDRVTLHFDLKDQNLAFGQQGLPTQSRLSCDTKGIFQSAGWRM